LIEKLFIGSPIFTVFVEDMDDSFVENPFSFSDVNLKYIKIENPINCAIYRVLILNVS